MAATRAGRWQVWIDRGGTFTDCIGRDPTTGALRVTKLLSDDDDAPLRGIRRLLGLAEDAAIPPCEVRMGTTLATNALLERKGAPTGLIISEGFADLLEIGDQSRPELFALDVARTPPLYAADAVAEVRARIGADGERLAELDLAEVDACLDRLRAAGARSLAIVLVHAYRDGGDESAIAARARARGFDHVTCSHEVVRELGLLGRGDTAVVDAYLTPVLSAYVRRLSAALPGSLLRIMQSSGDLTGARRFRGRDAILSGPAGGVVAVAAVAKAAGVDRAIGFDMGGTSTDVCRWAGDFERTYETRVAGVRVRTPMMAIHTVAAGGGSICAYDGHRFTVGPESAGADPGPLCYGRAGARDLALTDVNLLLGRLVGDRFPFALDEAAARAGAAAILEEVGDGRSVVDLAAGFFAVAIEHMAAAIRTISVARGHDVRNDALVVFGGAGGQHACPLARALGIHKLVFHPLAGVLSAYGMGVARVGWHGEADAGRRALEAGLLAALAPLFSEIIARGEALVREHEGLGADRLEAIRRVDLRYRGTETALTLTLSPGDDAEALRARFTAAHQREFGYARPEHAIEATTARVELVERRDDDALEADAEAASAEAEADASEGAPEPERLAAMWAEGELLADVPVYRREALLLRPGLRVDGPALILDATATIALDPGWTLEVRAGGILVADDRRPSALAAVRPRSGGAAAQVDPVLLEIFANRIMAIAEQMGVVLRRTALSTNIRERLDFSCAVFDAEGGLVANAPHIPVHLGAMSESVRGVMAAHPDPRPGEVFVTNDPAAGGSHLPDITVVAPVHDEGGALRYFVASRGHHADIGGIAPGSMPPDSTRLADEGIVLRALKIVDDGRLDRDGLLEVLRGGPHPARRPLENLADIEAQIAACRTGARLLGELEARMGGSAVVAYMGHLQDYAAATVERAIADLEDGVRTFADAMDDGTPVAVTVTVEGARMRVDFAGTGAAVGGNLNAPRAVTVAALLYVLRLLCGRAIPLNGGCLRPIDLRIPAGSLLDPPADRAVVAGNVETSQRVVDVLLGALGLAAASQGTMNNLTFGTDSFGYYETIGGGVGATATAAGASGIHSHMTNTRITDVEVLESRFPVRVRAFGLRGGSGGEGRHRGGDGLIRELEFLEPATVSIVAERRRRPPFGLRGGGPGALGVDTCNGEPLGGSATISVVAGDRVRIATPGGGGYGAPRPAGRDVRDAPGRSAG
ncbi:MAG: hydantoinase B/oxoprolinase family protein [Myxococcales bacterium]|nr:hydantoinase B/oxoprolinase family protein [Myxococcales bacterium]